MNVLKGTKVYCAGNLEKGSFQYAVEWREHVKNVLSPLGIRVLSPFDECFKNFPKEDELSFKKLKNRLAAGEFDYVHQQAKLLRNKDLAIIDNSTFLIVVLDMTTPTYGTIDEIVRAKISQKPVFLVVSGGYKNMSCWMASYFKPSWVYSNLEDALDAIKKIDSGEIEINTDYWRILSEEFR